MWKCTCQRILVNKLYSITGFYTWICTLNCPQRSSFVCICVCVPIALVRAFILVSILANTKILEIGFAFSLLINVGFLMIRISQAISRFSYNVLITIFLSLSHLALFYLTQNKNDENCLHVSNILCWLMEKTKFIKYNKMKKIFLELVNKLVLKLQRSELTIDCVTFQLIKIYKCQSELY